MKGELKCSERKHLAIIEAAVHEFQTYGYRGTSMERIAERANVSKRTLYNHFPGKEELFGAFVAHLAEQTHNVTEYRYYPEKSLREQLTAIAESELVLMSSPEVVALVRAILAECLRTPELAPKIFENMKKSEGRFVNWIKSARDDSRLSVGDPELAAEQLYALLKGFAFWPQIIGYATTLTPKERLQIVKSAVAMFLDHYTAP